MMRRGRVLLLLALAWAVSAPGRLTAFDTGHHADLTRSAMKEAGFGEPAIGTVQVTNWLSDYYSNQSLAGLSHDLELLHFDNLADSRAVDAYWRRLTDNTKRAAQAAARNGDGLRMLGVLGISVHAVQDFYSHSNWVESHLRTPGGPYRSETWFHPAQVEFPAGLRTGAYPNVEDGANNHGGYDPGGMNHDSYVRANWDQSYVFAHAATVEWLGAFREWVEEAKPGSWTALLAFAAPAGLARDLEASYRISEWIYTPGADPVDGHWKGNHSGAPGSLAAFAPGWLLPPDSPLVAMFKAGGLPREMAQGLDRDSLAGPLVDFIDVPRSSTQRRIVSVRTLEVRALPTGVLESDIDPGGSADFYANVTIGSQTFVESMQLDQQAIHPSWQTMAILPAATQDVPVVYQSPRRGRGGARGRRPLRRQPRGRSRRPAIYLRRGRSLLLGRLDRLPRHRRDRRRERGEQARLGPRGGEAGHLDRRGGRALELPGRREGGRTRDAERRR